MDWKRKLTSRKFWMAVAAFITPLLLSFGMTENTVTQVFQKGFKLGDKIVRFAMVQVAN